MKWLKSIACAWLWFHFIPALSADPKGSEALPFVRDTRMRAAANEAAIDLESRAAVEFAMLDYPSLHLSWLRQTFFSLDPVTQPHAYVRACWALANIEHLENEPRILQQLDTCLMHAEAEKLYAEWADIAYHRMNYMQAELDMAEYEGHMQGLLQKARDFGDPNAQAYLLSMYAIDLLRFKILDRSLPLISAALELMETAAEPSLVAFNITKNALGNSLRYRELHDEAMALDRELMKIYDSLGLRMLTIRLRYSLGFSLLFREQPDYAAAQTDLEAALQMGKDIQYRSLQGSCLSLLSLISSHKGEHRIAVQQAREAVRIFIEEAEELTLAYAQKRLAEVLIAKGDFQEAFVAMDQAQKNMEDQNEEFKKDLHWFRYKAWLGLGDKDRALAQLEAYTKIADEIARQREKDQYNRAAVSLGLQLEQEKNKTLERENRWQSEKLKEGERFRRLVVILAILSLSTLGLLVLSLRQVRRIRTSQQQLRRILDNIDEGLLTVDGRQLIGRDYSLHLEQIVGDRHNIAGQDFVSTIFNSPGVPQEQRSIIREILHATLHESRLAWDLNADNLPKEIHMGTEGEMSFVVRWIPIFNRADELEQLLVSLTDVTLARSLEKALGDRDKRLRSIPETLRELLALKPEHIENILHATQITLEQLKGGTPPSEIARDLHTHKGLARTLGLRELSQDLHDLETTWQHAGAEWELQEKVGEVQELLHEYRAFADVLHHERSTQATAAQWLAAVLDPHLGAWRQQLDAVQWPLAEFQVMDAVLSWEASDLALCREICLHAINNSLDHGYILPLQRGQKPQPPILMVQARRQGDNLVLDIMDNGVGLQQHTLEKLARERGFVPGSGETLADVLFTDGVSSADQVSLTSGRGIGLAAIKASVQHRGGRVSIQNRESGPGLILRATWPQKTQPSALSA